MDGNEFYRWEMRAQNKEVAIGLMKDLAKTRFMVLENRYDGDKDVPDDKGLWTLNAVYNAVPGELSYDGDGISHVMLGGGVASFDDVTAVLHCLLPEACMFRFNTLDERTRRYITHNIAPIEWHKGLDEGEPELMARIQVFGYEEPSIPVFRDI